MSDTNCIWILSWDCLSSNDCKIGKWGVITWCRCLSCNWRPIEISAATLGRGQARVTMNDNNEIGGPGGRGAPLTSCSRAILRNHNSAVFKFSWHSLNINIYNLLVNSRMETSSNFFYEHSSARYSSYLHGNFCQHYVPYGKSWILICMENKSFTQLRNLASG